MSSSARQAWRNGSTNLNRKNTVVAIRLCDAGTRNYEPYKGDSHNEFKPSYGSSYRYRPPYEPQKKTRRAPKIIGITLACIFAIVLFIIISDPFTPSLSANPLNFSFTVSNGLNPPTQILEIESSRRAITWLATDDAQWLNLDPADGSTDEETPITLSVDISGMYPGEYAATITIYAPDAKNKLLEIPASLIITETEVTLAIKEAFRGNMNNVEIYYDKQPPYSKGLLYISINLINSQSATDPTWQQLLQFIASDDTDEQTYIEGAYMCGSFAETLHNNAEQAGIRAAWVGIDFSDNIESHALNAFYTMDIGLVFVDCTGGGFEVVIPSFEDSYNSDTNYDKIAYVKIGEEYGSIDVDVARSPQYTFYEQYEQQWEEYESRLEEYNASVEEYNRRVKEYNREISRGTYEYSRMVAMYNDLLRDEEQLKREEEDLNQLQQDLGYYRWESLGVVSHVEIYW